MDKITNFSSGSIIGTFYGSAVSVSNRISAMDDDADVKALVIAISGITSRQAAQLSKSFKNSSAVHRYLSGADYSDFCELVVNAYLPKTVPMPTLLIQARVLRAERIAHIESGDFVTAKQMKQVLALGVWNTASRPNQWTKERRIFSFNHDGLDYFPLYALKAGKKLAPDPTVATILEIFGTGKTGLECAAWFAGANDFLSAATPKNTLTRSPEKVISAARAEMVSRQHHSKNPPPM